MRLTSRYLIVLLFLLIVPAALYSQESRFLPESTPAPIGRHFDIPSSPGLELEPPSFARISSPVMTPEAALRKFQSHGLQQNSQLREYTDETFVMAELTDSSQRGAFELQRSYVAPHTLTFKPIHYTGDSFVKSNVITRVLQSEVDYVSRGDTAQTALTAANYKFSYKGDQQLDGREVHVFQVKPRHKRPGLFKGRVYLDSSTGSLARSEGKIVKSPSFFIRNIQFVQDYADIDGYTLPVQLHTTARARFLGPAIVDVFHRQYQPLPLAASLNVSGAAVGQP